MAERAPSEPDVFLSYAREDEVRARELATALGQRGFSVFWDREVPPGRTWRGYIGGALGAAKCVVVAWSRHSIESRFVIQEAGEGADRDVLIPVLFEEVQPPFGFRDIHAANLIDWRPDRSSPAFDRLLSAVERIVGGQAGSGAEAEPEPQARRQSAPAEPAPRAKPAVRPATPSLASRESRAAPLKPLPGQASAWSRRTVLATIVGFLVIAGAGGTTFLWWMNQPERTPPERVAEAEPSPPAPESSEPPVEDQARPATSAPATTETAEPGDKMRDCAECPEMVLVPAGEFTMGSPPDEPGRDNDEGPQRTVSIAEPFWVGKYEVTFAEWDACVAAGGCSAKADDAGPGRDNRPVINVSWNDAKEYVGWLSQKTGKTYRLLSEAEWEYAARAGNKTAFWWGQDVGKGNANCDGCGSQWDNSKTAPVVASGPMTSACTIRQGMSGNGYRTAIATVMTARQRMALLGKMARIARGCSAAARGTAFRGSSGPRIASASTRSTGAASAGSGLPGRPIRSQLFTSLSVGGVKGGGAPLRR